MNIYRFGQYQSILKNIKRWSIAMKYTLLELNVVSGFCWFCCVHLHDVIVH